MISTFPSRHYNIDDFVAVKEYLLSFGIERLEQTGKQYSINNRVIKSRKKTNNKWFETQDSISYWNDFSKPKIIWGNLCLSAQFAYAKKDFYVNAPSPMIVPGSKFLLAILNSKLADWYIRQLGVTRNGGYFEYKPMFVEKLPVPQIDIDEQSEYISIVNEILNSKINSINTDLLENMLNSMVYTLYGLSESEIKYIED